ncbi:leucine-rich repeat-containing protein 74A-like isoform X1 [Sebastes umbrosus]|uniref:leucine-rich repeat-containing protein 74A-like isoform X1 n=1 Tax=Sebastes umbrosus TaxID=72105 RepID=UPI00189D62F9|nr:leucine-rich repeat-containing protein 74A-like isoform X1 [Sebastes umbrosus]XP_037606045.1 leucine-rich repeat-containing protein 74A-like isoform X1 [Sebastes umbrosus]
MDQCEEEINEDQQQSDLPTMSQDQLEEVKEKPIQGHEAETDLDTDSGCSQKPSLSLAERYLRACRRTGVVPASPFLRQLGEANINLNHYGLGPLGVKALAIALKHDNDVTNLELEDNGVQSEGARYLMEMLQRNVSIRSLNLSNNQLQLAGAISISKMLLDNYYIKSIKLSGNDFDDFAVKYLADAFEENYMINEVDLSHNKFCEVGGQHLGHMIATNIGIEVLNLSWNHIRMSGAVALIAGLKVNSTLEQLLLSWNGFGKVEAESLGQALRHNSNLVLLDLSSNHIDDKAVTLLCKGLAVNKTLRVLKLSHNPMTSIGALTLLKTVINNMESAVEEIDISTVFVGEAFVELLEEAHQKRPALDVKYNIVTSVTRNSSALQIFQKFLKERNESMADFFLALDEEGTMKVPAVAFRKAVKAANVPLDQQQLAWLVRKFDKNCTGNINYKNWCV